jgi:hypothetical protein
MTMEHAEAEELLPWLLNGSLEAADRRAVEDHLAGCAVCREALAEAELAFAIHALHPTEAQLVDLAWERLGGEARDVVAAHARGCPACAEELALLRASRSVLEADEQRAVGAPSVPVRILAFGAPARRRWALAAAVAGVALLGALGWRLSELASARVAIERELAAARAEGTRLRGAAAATELARGRVERELAGVRQELAGLRQPELNAPVIQLLPEELVLRGTPPGPPQLVERHGDNPRVTLILARPAGAPPAQALELRDLDGELLWRGEGLVEQPAGDYTVTLPVSLLPAAGAEIRLLGKRGQPAGRYRLRLRTRR